MKTKTKLKIMKNCGEKSGQQLEQQLKLFRSTTKNSDDYDEKYTKI